MSPPELACYADLGPSTGSGHVSRQIALAGAWKKFGGKAVIHTPSEPGPRLVQQASSLEIQFGGGNDVGDVVVIDSYLTGSSKRSAIASDRPCLELDDFAQVESHPGDILLDQNFGASGECSGRPNRRNTWSLYGPRFALLRPEFRFENVQGRSADEKPRLGLLLGGSPPPGLLKHLTEGLRLQFPQHELHVADGSIVDMKAFYTKIDVAITAGGSSVLELASQGIPLVVMSLAGNQTRVVEELGTAGLALTSSVEDAVPTVAHLVRDVDMRGEMSARLRDQVDGLGPDRAATFLASMLLDVRPVGSFDAGLLFEWANDPDTRRNSFSPAEILWCDHLTWLGERLDSPADSLYIVEDHGSPVAHVRFATKTGLTEISVTVSPSVRGRGFGGRAIRSAVNRFRSESPHGSSEIRAFIKPTNVASAKAFMSASFVRNQNHSDPLLYVDRCDRDVIFHRDNQRR